MDAYLEAAAYLPPFLGHAVQRVAAHLQRSVHEIRLRENAPVTLSSDDGEWWVLQNGLLTTALQPGLAICTSEHLEECLLRLCGYSVHTHQEELRGGLICTENGFRAGLGGSVVYDNGREIGMRRITSICIRIPRRHDGCALPLLEAVSAQGQLFSTLLCGAPSTGKTSLLRDAARLLSEGATGRKFRVAVVDERGELSVSGALRYCDVLSGCRKAEGIVRAIRTLAPEVVVFDEWGTEEECVAVEYGIHCGITVLTSSHCTIGQLEARPPFFRNLLHSQGIACLVQLADYTQPGKIREVIRTEEWNAEVVRNGMRDFGRCGDRIP